MINQKRIVALIPARGGSKGLPRKNVLNLCGKPLLGWPIDAALKSRFVDRVLVSTDDKEIADIAVHYGADVPFMRPSELASDTASSISVIEHALDFLAEQGDVYDYLVLLEPTSPLTETDDIDSAIKLLELKRHIADSIVGVSKIESTHPVFDVTVSDNGLISPYVAGSFASAGRRQEIADLYFFDGSLYISDVSVLRKKHGFYHERTLSYIGPKWKAFEVDDIVDFICIEAILNNIKILKGEGK